MKLSFNPNSNQKVPIEVNPIVIAKNAPRALYHSGPFQALKFDSVCR